MEGLCPCRTSNKGVADTLVMIVGKPRRPGMPVVFERSTSSPIAHLTSSPTRAHLTDHGQLRSGFARSQIMIEATVTVAS